MPDEKNEYIFMIFEADVFDQWDNNPFVGRHPVLDRDAFGFTVTGSDLADAWLHGKATAFDFGWSAVGTVSRLVKVMQKAPEPAQGAQN